nr:hypothetical protein [Tanacetum cinerariifolium]
MLHPELPGPGDRIVDFPEGKVDGMSVNGTYSVEAVRALDTHRTPIQKQPEMLLCFVEISRRYYLGDEVYLTFHYDDDRGGNGPIQFDSCPKSYQGAPADVSDPDPLSFANVPSHHPVDVAQSSQGIAAVGDPKSENVSSPAEVGSPGSVYRPEWDVTNGSLLDTPEACQDQVDHAAPLGYFSELRHMHNEEFLRQYNVNLAWQVAIGSQLRLRFEQEAMLLRKFVAQVARRDKRIEARELEIKNMEALLETEADMKSAAKDKSARLIKELEDMRARFSDLQVSQGQLSQ